MNAPQDLNLATAPIGTLIAGGILAGRFFVDVQPFALIVSPKNDGEFPATVWSKSLGRVDGAFSDVDGLANTKAMAAAGSALAQKILVLQIGGLGDWHLPSRGELLLAWSARAAMPKGEEFEEDVYWSSTQYHRADFSGSAWTQYFDGGSQSYWYKDNELLARAVRRVAI